MTTVSSLAQADRVTLRTSDLLAPFSGTAASRGGAGPPRVPNLDM